MINGKVVWTTDPLEGLQKLETKIRNKVMRIALNAGAAPMKAALIASAPAELGHLKKSIKIKVRNYQKKNYWVAMVGAGSKFKRLRKVKSKARDKGKSKVIRPAKYFHFVDAGTSKMGARRFVPVAYKNAEQAFVANVKRKLIEQIKIALQN